MTGLPATNVSWLHPPCTEDWPAPAHAAVFGGLAGEIAHAIEPHQRLAATGRIHSERHQQRGRSAELWHARDNQPASSPERRTKASRSQLPRRAPQPGIRSFIAYRVTTFKTRLQQSEQGKRDRYSLHIQITRVEGAVVRG